MVGELGTVEDDELRIVGLRKRLAGTGQEDNHESAGSWLGDFISLLKVPRCLTGAKHDGH